MADDEQYPTLADITLESVPIVRTLISDLAMDVLLYQSGYRENIMTVVQQECNRIFQLFKERNPSFKGSVSLCGHSLGSAMLFDLLCYQPSAATHSQPVRAVHKGKRTNTTIKESGAFPLDFECQAFFCLGSPIALFQMLGGNTIAGRSMIDTNSVKSTAGFDRKHESMVDSPVPKDRHTNVPGARTPHDIPTDVSSPKCEQLYNIFHPCDPIGYRLEPLISPAMTTLKPQPLPSVKKSIWTTSSQSLTNIGSRMGQSVGSFWTNFTSGVASSLLNRSLGLNAEDPAIQGANAEGASGDKREAHDENTKFHEEHLQTLLDQDLETLYEGFRKSRHSLKKNLPQNPRDALAWLETEKRAKKLKAEETKVRALNSNGRVDYSVQE
jgi:DDHD domain